MLGPDPDQQRRMAGEMDRSIEQIERETSAVLKRLVVRWGIRWAVVFAVIFLLTQSVDWLDWLWWIAVPIAVVSLAVPLLFRRFLIGRLERVRGQFGMFGGQGETIDGSWHDAGTGRRDPPRDEPAGVIIDQRPRGDGDD
ncbi:hypothetical protein ABC955_14130 [Citromicrobium bathyomarinum]|jgi:hypothetical protein|uniref:hypothetical protein n=1 Tax=unclassified Citromicrobium TaxID=2630544 RepID=UPI0006C93477|nr:MULTISPECIES: hypothetical protein [unclassified Citromicrobium]KPM24991.1 hypothetical protein AAJ72_04620 [Citromicrobium sp. RCC1885]KPM28233.1 hypothetical protein AAJ74_05360 [Citromicrobium sp. RCC1878]MAO04539.1 hypothetical protein [Citromicrobium sp.]OAM10243.1 hypothetical protein A0U43_04050 [Citromicrobium sp. RCC1897]|tara:strand:- start:126 stop:545 length:420 start_codon:yes stop_codon:yes gene_type:complete